MVTTSIVITLSVLVAVMAAMLCFVAWYAGRLVLAMTRLAVGREVFTKTTTPPPPSRFTQELYDEIMPKYHTPDAPMSAPWQPTATLPENEEDGDDQWETVGQLGPLITNTPDEEVQ